MRPKVSVVIPNYNGKDYLEKCVDSLMNQDVRSFEIIVVDDASSDDSFEIIKRKYPENAAYPQTKYLRHETNMGFCQSVNDGINLASADYIFLLNNDTEARKECVRELYQAITKSEVIFSVSAKMVSMQNPEIMDDAGDYYCILGWAFAPAKDKKSSLYKKKKKIFSACGGAAIYRKDVLCQLGMFDENHFAYLEDVDLGYRAKLHGYQNIFSPKAVVLHAGSASSGSRYNEFKAKLTAKNNLYLIYKNMPNWQIALNFLPLCIGTVVKVLFYTKKKMGKTYVNGLKEGYALCKSEAGKSKRQDFSRISASRIWSLQGELLLNLIRKACSIFI